MASLEHHIRTSCSSGMVEEQLAASLVAEAECATRCPSHNVTREASWRCGLVKILKVFEAEAEFASGCTTVEIS